MKYITIILTTLIVIIYSIPNSSAIATTQVFSDVPENHSNFNDIRFLLEKGVIEPFNTYSVNDVVTREEVAVMIAKAVGLDETQRDTKFSDVPKSNINSGYIQSAVDSKIIYGYEDGTFKPHQKVTRGHVAVFIARAFDLKNGSVTFKDVPKESSLYTAITQLVASGITSGYADGTFKPSNNLTHGHVSAFLARAIQNVPVRADLAANEGSDEFTLSKSSEYNYTSKNTESNINELISKHAIPQFGLEPEENIDTFKNELQLLLTEQSDLSTQLEGADIKFTILLSDKEALSFDAQNTRYQLDILNDQLANQRELISALNQDIKDYTKNNKYFLSGTNAQKEQYNNELAILKNKYAQLQAVATSLQKEVTRINQNYTDIKNKLDKIRTDITDHQNLITYYKNVLTTISKVKIKIYDIEVVAKNDILKKAIEEQKLELTGEEADVILNQLITYQYEKGKDIPIPGGLTADEALQKAKYEFDRIEGGYAPYEVNITSYMKDSNLTSFMKDKNYTENQRDVQNNTSPSIIYHFAKAIDVPLAEFVKGANYAVETGNVYYGENFILYYKFGHGSVKFGPYNPNLN